MMKSLGLVGFSLLLALSVAGCEKVEKCKRGELGCLGGAPNGDAPAGQECAAGLVSSGSTCIEPGDLPGYCDDVDEVPETRQVPPSCSPRDNEVDSWSFAEVCRRRCLQQCRRMEVLCEGFTCDRDCSGMVVQRECENECPNDTDLSCITGKCQEIQTRSCSNFTCPAGNPRNCDDVKCSDSCSARNIDDTFCDDGDPSSAVYSLCAFGTDCTDCGPRRGSRPARSPIQGLCPAGRDLACADYNDDYERNEAFCVHVPGTQDGQFSCVQDCTSEDEDCPDGFDCEALVYGSTNEPYTDLNGVQGYACFPSFCGQ